MTDEKKGKTPKFKITHNKMSEEELEIIYESLQGAMDLED